MGLIGKKRELSSSSAVTYYIGLHQDFYTSVNSIEYC